MQIEWTNEIITLLAVGCVLSAAFSWLIAIIIQSKKVTALSTQLDQSEVSYDTLNQQYLDVQAELQLATADIHQHDMTQSKQEQQIANLQATESRLQEDIAQQKTTYIELDEKHFKTSEQLRTVEKQHGTAQADIRSHIAQIDDLKTRLLKTESDKQTNSR